MLSQLLEKNETPRDKLFWVVLAALVLGQLIAFWMLCNHQMRKAEVREAEVQVHQMAIADCLQYVPSATIASCQSRVAPLNHAAPLQVSAPVDRHTALNSTVPVSFAFR